MAFASICMAQAEAGDVRGAVETAKLVADPKDRALLLINVAWSRPLDAAAAALLKDAALAAESGLSPSDPDPDFLARLAEVQARLGEASGATSTARRIRSDADRGRALASVLASRAAAGDRRASLETAEREAQPVARAYALAGVAEGILPQPDPPERSPEAAFLEGDFPEGDFP